MSYLKCREYSIPCNKGKIYILDVYKCDECKCELPSFGSWYRKEGIDYCCDCAFKKGLVNSEEYLKIRGGFDPYMFKAAVYPQTGEIFIEVKKFKFWWEKTDKDYRNTSKYSEWRKSVFERDSYICQKCKTKGRTLNAHHIKSYSKNKELRYELSNGITLCESYHRKEHKKKK